jgi:succinoglycan biosynthesis transport protein ExoP
LGIVANGCKNDRHSYRQRPVGLETLYDQKLSALGTKNHN